MCEHLSVQSVYYHCKADGGIRKYLKCTSCAEVFPSTEAVVASRGGVVVDPDAAYESSLTANDTRFLKSLRICR